MKQYNYPHRRYNPLKDEWILVSPQRAKRPWKGAVEKPQIRNTPSYDPKCYLCPGNKRISGEINLLYKETYVFPNDFQAVEPRTPEYHEESLEGIFQMKSVTGECRVVCFSPQHNKTLTHMSDDEIVKVLITWKEQISELSKKYEWIQIFENKGEIMGCSNPHPHAQIWATSTIPSEVQKEDQNQKIYLKKTNNNLLATYLKHELKEKKRVVLQNANWAVIVPYWALWPFETMILPKKEIQQFEELDEESLQDLSLIMKQILNKYDNLFQTIFPYTMGWHFAPYNGKKNDHWLMHAHFYPPLLRSASIKKFVVGYEMLGETQRDITPEWAALRLQEL
jgi:UDPglucose--hexose-1-phosphate uridylyltransferase